MHGREYLLYCPIIRHRHHADCFQTSKMLVKLFVLAERQLTTYNIIDMKMIQSLCREGSSHHAVQVSLL